jgi:hypothetical protein
MDKTVYVEKLTRAWVFVQVDDAVAEATAERIYKLNEHPVANVDWPEYHIVRADVVKPWVDEGLTNGTNPATIVVPVWAPDEKSLERILKLIKGESHEAPLQVLMVARGDDPKRKPLQYPFPPEQARGYITVEETNPRPGPLALNGWG